MALNFPSNPSENDIYQFGLLTFLKMGNGYHKVEVRLNFLGIPIWSRLVLSGNDLLLKLV
jgi:hypothetical protein